MMLFISLKEKTVLNKTKDYTEKNVHHSDFSFAVLSTFRNDFYVQGADFHLQGSTYIGKHVYILKFIFCFGINTSCVYVCVFV